jgi:AcrR family transcriptional regulator
MPRRAGQPLLTREKILAAALQVIDRDGLDALSMRRLGTELGVDPMAIYHHVRDKDALLHGVVAELFAQLPRPAPNDNWQQRVVDWAAAYLGLAMAHPNLVLRIVTDPAAVAVAAVRANEALFGALEAAGLAPAQIVPAVDLIVDYVNGFVLAEFSGALNKPAAQAILEAELAARPASEVAAQRRVLDALAGQPPIDSFGFGLRTILGGLERLRPARS